MKKRSRVLRYALPILASLVMIVAAFSIAKTNFWSRPLVLAQAQPAAGNTVSGQIERIGAVGLVEPSSQLIKIGTNISGIVEKVFVQPSSNVKAGDPLFALDRRALKAVLAQRHSELAVAKAELQETRARIPALLAIIKMAQAEVGAAKAETDDFIDLVRIAKQLESGSGISEREKKRRQILLRRSQSKLLEAQAKLIKAKAELSLFDEDKGGASIAVKLSILEKTQAAVKLAETNLDLGIIRAPISGTVLQVNVRKGEFALAGNSDQPLMLLGNTASLHVRVDVDEEEIHRFRSDTKAVAAIRGLPDRKIELSFVRTEPLVIPKHSLSGRIEERVDTRVLQIIYKIENDVQNIFPGQLLDIFITSEKGKTNTARNTPR